MGLCAQIRPPGRDELAGGRSREVPSEIERFLWGEQNLGEFGEPSGIGDRWSGWHRDPGRACLRPALSGRCGDLPVLPLPPPSPPLPSPPAKGKPASPGPLRCLLKTDNCSRRYLGRDGASAKARGGDSRGIGRPFRSPGAGEAGAAGGEGGARPGSGSGLWEAFGRVCCELEGKVFFYSFGASRTP